MNAMSIRFGKPVDRIEYGARLSLGKSVLHIGCTGGNRLQNPDESVHARLHRSAELCVGIDILEDQIVRFGAHGYDVRLADAEDFSLPKTDFDMIYAGEVIEHLSNPGRFLMCANRHLPINGKLILTTPQPFTIRRFIPVMLSEKYPQVHSGHTCWYDPYLLTHLLERYGFGVEEYHPSGLSDCGLVERALVRIRKTLAPEFVVLANKRLELSPKDVRRFTERSQVTG